MGICATKMTNSAKPRATSRRESRRGETGGTRTGGMSIWSFRLNDWQPHFQALGTAIPDSRQLAGAWEIHLVRLTDRRVASGNGAASIGNRTPANISAKPADALETILRHPHHADAHTHPHVLDATRVRNRSASEINICCESRRMKGIAQVIDGCAIANAAAPEFCSSPMQLLYKFRANCWAAAPVCRRFSGNASTASIFDLGNWNSNQRHRSCQATPPCARR